MKDGQRIDYLAVIQLAIDLGYHSVMVDGSRLSLDENIAATKKGGGTGPSAGIPARLKLGAVLGHEAGPLPPYDELSASGKGFHEVDEARRFVAENGLRLGFRWRSGIFMAPFGRIQRPEKKLPPA